MAQLWRIGMRQGIGEQDFTAPIKLLEGWASGGLGQWRAGPVEGWASGGLGQSGGTHPARLNLL
jgi:hypothetical protein